MLFFMNGEPSLHPKLFEYVDARARSNGFRYFGMSSHFRAFADPHFALKVLEAGFEFFDISLHAATLEAQAEVNPIERRGSLAQGGAPRPAQRLRDRAPHSPAHRHDAQDRHHAAELPRPPAHLPVRRTDLGVRNFILQPVKASGLEPELDREASPSTKTSSCRS